MSETINRRPSTFDLNKGDYIPGAELPEGITIHLHYPYTMDFAKEYIPIEYGRRLIGLPSFDNSQCDRLYQVDGQELAYLLGVRRTNLNEESLNSILADTFRFDRIYAGKLATERCSLFLKRVFRRERQVQSRRFYNLKVRVTSVLVHPGTVRPIRW